MAELSSLLHAEIPEGRSNLTDNHTNLERVAEYCEANYFQSDSKRGALEETKNYTTQSLASVAYQINTLAYNFLQLLELQTGQLAEMESQMNHISQTVMIHKEKVARREIGVLTANKSTTRHYKIIAPAVPEKPIKYIRRAIDYNVLDDIGHGARSGTPRGPNKGGGLQRGNSQSGSMQALVGNNGVMMGAQGPGGGGGVVVGQVGQAGVGPPPTTKPPTPPSVTRTGSKVSVSGGTLSKSSNREYRTPPAVAPPQVPSHYAPNYPLGHPRRAGNELIVVGNNVAPRGPGYSALPLGQLGPAGQQQIMSPPGGGMQQQVGMVHPMSVHQSQQQHPQTPPPPPPPTATGNGGGLYGDHHNSMPPPPSPLTIPITTQSTQSQINQPSHFASHSLLLPQHGPVPAGSLGMHTLSHHHQAQYLQSIQRSLSGIRNSANVNSGNVTSGDSRDGVSGVVSRGSLGGGGNSPPLPPPPPPMSDVDVDDTHAAFGRPVGGLMRGRGGGGEGVMAGGLGGGVRPIVPDEEDLPGWVPKNYIEKVVAIYDYYADKDDELSFQESSVIYVLKKNDDGWWEGVMDGITGLFPGNYVEPCV